jgi:hypothetical protein
MREGQGGEHNDIEQKVQKEMRSYQGSNLDYRNQNPMC